MPYSWKHTVCSHFRLASFTKWYVFRFPPCLLMAGYFIILVLNDIPLSRYKVVYLSVRISYIHAYTHGLSIYTHNCVCGVAHVCLWGGIGRWEIVQMRWSRTASLFVCFFLLPHLRYMEVSGLGVESELQLLADTRIGAVAIGRHHSPCNTRGKPYLPPTLQLSATPDPQPRVRGQGSNWPCNGILAGFRTHGATTGTPSFIFS